HIKDHPFPSMDIPQKKISRELQTARIMKENLSVAILDPTAAIKHDGHCAFDSGGFKYVRYSSRIVVENHAIYLQRTNRGIPDHLL
ncbi:14766_t:CDS:1, partial [Acaulospora colombiana]